MKALRQFRRWMRAVLAEWLADLGAFLRSLDQKPQPKRKR
jgi:hypothetical protein